MGIGDIIALVSFIFGMIIAYPALLILLNILFSGTTTKAAYRLHRGMKLPFFVGLVITIIGGFIVVFLLSAAAVPSAINFRKCRRVSCVMMLPE